MKQLSLSQIKNKFYLLLILNIFFLIQSYNICSAETAETKIEAAQIDIKDGEYSVNVTLEGGSGKAAISSPAKLIVKDNHAYARIEWSSSNYDYMKIGEEMFTPINTEGNSVFEIPVIAFDEPISIIADTIAMSMPHEISYTLTFHMNSVKKENASNPVMTIVIIIVCVIAIIAIVNIMLHRKKK